MLKFFRFYTELCLLKNLKCLNLGSNRYLQPRDIMTISINCQQLQSLEILDIPWNSKGKLSDENFRFIMQRLRNSLLELKFDMQQLKNPSYLVIINSYRRSSLKLSNLENPLRFFFGFRMHFCSEFRFWIYPTLSGSHRDVISTK